LDFGILSKFEVDIQQKEPIDKIHPAYRLDWCPSRNKTTCARSEKDESHRGESDEEIVGNSHLWIDIDYLNAIMGSDLALMRVPKI